jgi:GH25 family lysozyme M1 (1,4-beta-N-acetylmuramidase)
VIEHTYTLGVDVASPQGPNVNFRTFVPRGIRFTIQKATQGATGTDPTFARNIVEIAEHVGIGGVYWWPEPRHDPLKEAQRLADVAGKALERFADPIVMMDLEDDDRTHPGGPVRGEPLVARSEAALLEVERLLGIQVLLYTGKWFWREAIGKTLARVLTARPLCHAQYPRSVCPGGKMAADYAAELRALPAEPDLPDPWTHATFWQFDGDKGLVLPQGVDSDFDRFDGSVDDLRAWCRGRRIRQTLPDGGLQLGDDGPAHPLGVADRAEADAAAVAFARGDNLPDTSPGTPRTKSSQRMAAVKAPILGVDDTTPDGHTPTDPAPPPDTERP